MNHVDNYDGDYFYNNLIALNSIISDAVVNQSFIFGGQDATVDQTYDNYVALHKTMFVSGAGNGGAPNSPATCYNGIGVGAYGGSSSVGPTSDGRSKPDITAPAGATSFSTPLVAGAAAILVQAGTRGDGGTGTATAASDPRTVKALLLNGAVKQTGWTHTTTTVLDTAQGAGLLNIYNSYLQLKAGQHTFTTSNTSQTPPAVSGSFGTLSGWDFVTSLTSSGTSDQVNHYFFDLNSGLGSSFTVTSTLVWLRHNQKTSINNLDLYLYKADGTLIASSVSTVDNVEHLFTSYLAPGRYDLEVVKHGANSVTATETYALAFNFAASSTLSASISTGGNDATVSFPSIAGHTYRVECSYDLATWTTLSDNIAGTGLTILTTDLNALIQSKKFYRAKVLQ